MSNVKKVIGHRVLAVKLSAQKKSIIAMPDSTIQKTFLGVITKVGSLARKATLTENRICLFNAAGKIPTPRANEFIFKEEDILTVKDKGIYRPLGYRVLIQRLNNTEVKNNGIIIPMGFQSSDQTLFGIVYSLGIFNNKVIDYPLDPGDIVKIERWDMLIQEIDIDGVSYLSVPVSLLEYKCIKEVFKDNFVK